MTKKGKKSKPGGGGGDAPSYDQPQSQKKGAEEKGAPTQQAQTSGQQQTQQQQGSGRRRGPLQQAQQAQAPVQEQQQEGSWRRGPPQQAQQAQAPVQEQQQQPGAWGKGPPQQPQTSGQQQTQQQQGGGRRRGPPQQAQTSGEQQTQQQQGSGRRRGPLQQAQQAQAPVQEQQQQPGAWGRGPPQQPQTSGQQQTQQQQGGGRRRGPPQQAQQAQAPVQEQQQQPGAWGKGPPQQAQQAQAPVQEQQQQPGAWGKGPPQQARQAQAPVQEQQQQPGAWGKGPPQQARQAQAPVQQQQQQPGAWGKGPPPHQVQQQQPQEGSWRRGPPQQTQQTQAPVQQQQQPGAWGRGPPPPQQAQQPQAPPQQSGGQERGFQEHQQREQKTSKGQGRQESQALVSTCEFAPRIFAQRKTGREIKVYTNFFPLIIKNPNITICHYDVEIDPLTPKYLLRKVWNKYVSLAFPGRLTAFDGKNAYSKGPLVGNLSTTTVTVFNEENGKDKEFKVSIKKVREINFSCFQNYMAKALKERSSKSLPQAETSVLEIIIRNWVCDNFVRSGHNFFPPTAVSPRSEELSKKLALKYGYFQSVFLGYKPYLNFDISHKAFYKDLPMLEVLQLFQNYRTKELDVDKMNHFIRGVKVSYKLPNNSQPARVFRVNKLAETANKQKFQKDEGKTMTVEEYFAIEKKLRLRYPDLPLLWVGPNQKSIYVPMEFCTILPDQIYRGMLDSFETREMVNKATTDARQRYDNVYDLFQKANINSHPLMKEFELSVSENMEVVPARVLDAPGLKTSRNIRVRDGVWRIQDFLDPVTMNKWCILNLDKRMSRESLMLLQRMIKEKGMNFNMNINDPARDPVEGDSNIPNLKRAFSQLKDMNLVFVVIPDDTKVYSRVKSICETQEGILTQCIKSKTASQPPAKFSTTVENILLKVNAKLGGRNHCLDRNSVPQCLNGKVMVVGADVTHPSPGMKIPSVAAVTASCDANAFQYGTTTRLQPKGEMIQNLEEIIGIHLRRFREIRGSYPEKIIFFRDGVSEGEMEKVFKGELAAVKNACRPHCDPKITLVTVQKRHHARFFPVSQADEQGKNYNVPVGTCVDTDVVHPRDMEFYLVSHASIKGTARPTKYRLLYDDNKLTDDELERLAYYLCHLFSRCNRSVSYPAPTYNAHLAAARVRAYLEGLNLTGGLEVQDIQNKMPDRISSKSPMFFV